MVMDRERLGALERQGAADLVELFSSIQGEGPRVGQRHLFVRTVHCDIHCAYCDTPLCHAPRAKARILGSTYGAPDFEVANPIALPALSALVEAPLRALRHAAVSFTGGEPLLQPWVIRHLAPLVRAHGAAVLLETDGNLPDAFSSIQDSVDVLSMDWKLPSATREPDRSPEHHRMLALGRERGLECCVKAVFVEETTASELEPLIRTVREVDPMIPVILQPCTPFRHVREAPTMEHALSLHRVVADALPDVRLLPQVHRLLRLP